MTTPNVTFTSANPVDALTQYHQELREIERYTDLEIEVSYCSYK